MLFISDIHGVLPALERALELGEKLKYNQLILLGDLLNHGPRNPVLPGYDPAKVAERLNGFADRIVAVRGNCDSEVDQMLCDFPIMAPYNWLIIEGRRLCLTHGHSYRPESLPPLRSGDGFCYGHTHVPVADWIDGIMHFNPGSIALGKGGHTESLGHFDGERFRVLDLSGRELASTTWKAQ
ncbi:phosphodiesterase [Ferrimonas balearica]|uniref:phosphodiesterase n=1 Tax=Ferrimonas balearica TaxID=44012 RepID=UPI001C9A2A27|nr:phosphodiesterase [Ferrimonas balearica]MBY5991294.1 phosphodiesterase [Ferrimonas balearica]